MEDIVVVAISSNLEAKDYSIQFTNNDLIEGTIKVTSIIRTDKIYTLSKYIVVKKFGCVKKEIINKIKVEINNLLEE